jgi:PPOX class probable FMN-dependent enzyme
VSAAQQPGIAAFRDPVRSEAELRSIVPAPTRYAYRKQLDHLDGHCRALIEAAPLVFVATSDADGRCDVSPRGGPPGWVRMLDSRRVALPEAPGNRRLDSLGNVLATGWAALLFVVPGRNETLRVQGPATVTRDPDLLATIPLAGRLAPLALGVEAEEVFTHCGKAFMRSGAWDPTAWPAVDDLPSPAEVLRDHVADGSTLAEVAGQMQESYTQRMW